MVRASGHVNTPDAAGGLDFRRRKARRFAKELRSEIKKVVWPTKKQVLNNTCVVGAVMIAVGGFIWIIDWIFAILRGLILGF